MGKVLYFAIDPETGRRDKDYELQMRAEHLYMQSEELVKSAEKLKKRYGKPQR